LSEYNAGETIVLHVGESFQVALDRSDPQTSWSWPAVVTQIVRNTDGPVTGQAENIEAKVMDLFNFSAVSPGATDLFAELAPVEDPTQVRARFAIVVQVEP